MATNELKTNKVRRLRGSASIREDGTFDFRPDGQGTSKQEDIKTVRKSRSYRTSGEKQQSIVAHIAVAADTKDPAYEMYRDFREITKDLGGFERIEKRGVSRTSRGVSRTLRGVRCRGAGF